MRDLVSELIERLKSADKDITEAIASGVNIHNFETYQRFVGKKEGLSEALGIIESLLTEDDEDQY
jgi:hypothetical protein